MQVTLRRCQDAPCVLVGKGLTGHCVGKPFSIEVLVREDRFTREDTSEEIDDLFQERPPITEEVVAIHLAKTRDLFDRIDPRLLPRLAEGSLPLSLSILDLPLGKAPMSTVFMAKKEVTSLSLFERVEDKA